MDIKDEEGIFGKFNDRDYRLAMLFTGLGASVVGLCPVDWLRMALGFVGMVFFFTVIYNQINRNRLDN